MATAPAAHLQRGSSQQQSTRRVEVQQRLPLLRAKVLDVLRLVEHEVLPRLATEHLLVGDDHIVRGDHHVEGVLLAPALAFRLQKKRQMFTHLFNKDLVTQQKQTKNSPRGTGERAAECEWFM